MANYKQGIAVIFAGLLIGGCEPAVIEPPVAKRIDHVMVNHGVERNDPYYWLRDDTRSDKEILAYLEQENEYTNAVLSNVAELEESLYQRVYDRFADDSASQPYHKQGCRYRTDYAEGANYEQLLQRCATYAERVILDFEERSAGHSFFEYSGYDVSPDGSHIAWLEDHEGRRQFKLFVKNLVTDQVTQLSVQDLGYGLVWRQDSKSVFVVQREQGTLREHRVLEVLTDNSAVRVVLHEPDEEYALYIDATRSGEYLVISSTHTEQTHLSLVDLNKENAKPTYFVEPADKHQLTIDHVNDYFYVVSNFKAPNGQLFRVAEAQHSDMSQWQLLVGERQEALIESLVAFDDDVYTLERVSGYLQIAHRQNDGQLVQYIPKQFDADTIYFGANYDIDSKHLNVVIEGLTQPEQHFSYAHKLGSSTTQRLRATSENTHSNISSDDYVVESHWITARDGERVLATTVRHKSTPTDGSAALWVYGYGAYGSSSDSWFSVARTVLLDEGFIWAIAHVRGGKELGASWYDQGRLMHKKNSFTDFVDVTKGLLEKGYGADGRVYAEGASAGGLLMGGVINIAPDLYNGVIAGVPFVDVVTTMLDASIPLTTFEWDEWGNPIDKEAFDYMLSYSPYDQVSDIAYPNLLVTSGLHDSQVQYFEPTKWVAKMRHHWNSPNLLLLDTNMTAGHGGASGRYGAAREEAKHMAFILGLDKKQL